MVVNIVNVGMIIKMITMANRLRWAVGVTCRAARRG